MTIEKPRARMTWREICAGIGWGTFALCVIASIVLIGSMFGPSVGLALGGGGMSREGADGIRIAAYAIGGVALAVFLLACVAQRWALMFVSLVMVGAMFILSNGHVATY